eukprot:scaffold2007_cov123-Isochrysis_galbana.AAC.4
MNSLRAAIVSPGTPGLPKTRMTPPLTWSRNSYREGLSGSLMIRNGVKKCSLVVIVCQPSSGLSFGATIMYRWLSTNLIRQRASSPPMPLGSAATRASTTAPRPAPIISRTVRHSFFKGPGRQRQGGARRSLFEV